MALPGTTYNKGIICFDKGKEVGREKHYSNAWDEKQLHGVCGICVVEFVVVVVVVVVVTVMVLFVMRTSVVVGVSEYIL